MPTKVMTYDRIKVLKPNIPVEVIYILNSDLLSSPNDFNMPICLRCDLSELEIKLLSNKNDNKVKSTPKHSPKFLNTGALCFPLSKSDEISLTI